MNEQSTESPAVGIIIAIFFIALLSFIIFMLVMTTKARHSAKKNMQMFKKGIFQPVKATFAHASGLPISPGVCAIYTLRKTVLIYQATVRILMSTSAK